MTDRPIPFTALMIRALLDGRKTQTRRVAKRSNSTVLGERWGPKAPWGGLLFDHPKAIARTTSTLMDVIVGEAEAPYDPHIDVPWVHPEDAARGDKWEDDECMYRVRPIWEVGDRLWVRGSRFMPRRESRLTLEVTGVKVERLQEISEEDAIAEGCQAHPAPRLDFVDLWNSIHGLGAWGRNPWVYALTFNVRPANPAIRPAPPDSP